MDEREQTWRRPAAAGRRRLVFVLCTSELAVSRFARCICTDGRGDRLDGDHKRVAGAGEACCATSTNSHREPGAPVCVSCHCVLGGAGRSARAAHCDRGQPSRPPRGMARGFRPPAGRPQFCVTGWDGTRRRRRRPSTEAHIRMRWAWRIRLWSSWSRRPREPACLSGRLARWNGSRRWPTPAAPTGYAGSRPGRALC